MQIFSDTNTADGWKIAHPIISSTGTIIVGMGLTFCPAGSDSQGETILICGDNIWCKLFFGFMFVYGGMFSLFAKLAGSTHLLLLWLEHHSPMSNSRSTSCLHEADLTCVLPCQSDCVKFNLAAPIKFSLLSTDYLYQYQGSY